MAKQKRIRVSAGDLIVYCPREAGHGGWVKVEKGEHDQTLTRDRCVMAIAEQGFEYDDGVGLAYHDVPFKVVRRFFEDPKVSQIVDERSLEQAFSRYLDVSAAPV